MKRSLLITGIIAAFALTAAIIVFSIPSENEQEILPHPTSEPAVKIDLVNEQHENVTNIHFEPQGNVPYSIMQNISDREYELILKSDDALFPGRPAVMRIIFGYAVSLRNLSRITEAADDTQLSMFGFDEPVMKWRIERIDGTVIEMIVGAQQATGRGHYVREKDSREIFLLGEMQSEYLTMVIEELYDFSFYPFSPSQDDPETWNLINHLLLERSDDVLELKQRTAEETADAGPGASVYRIIQPIIGDCNDQIVKTVLLENIVNIKPERIISVFPVDLSDFGLDSPYRLSISTPDWTGVLLIGNRSAEHGGRYVVIDGVDAVLLDPSGDYSFLATDPTQLRTRIIWMHSINDVSSVSYELDGVQRYLQLEHDVINNSLQGWLDGEAINETNTRRLFMYTLGISQTGGTNADIPDTSPVYSITIKFTDNSDEKLELFALNDSQFLIVKNGISTGFYITRMTLQQNLLNRFEAIDRGEELTIY